MAKPKPIYIDGKYREMKPTARIIDVVPPEVSSIVTQEGALMPCSESARVLVSECFQTNPSAINKGAGAITVLRSCNTLRMISLSRTSLLLSFIATVLGGCATSPELRQAVAIPPFVAPVIHGPAIPSPPGRGCMPFDSIVRPGAPTSQVADVLLRAGYVIAKVENGRTTWRCGRMPAPLPPPAQAASTAPYPSDPLGATPTPSVPPTPKQILVPTSENSPVQEAAPKLVPSSPADTGIRESVPALTPQSLANVEARQLAKSLLPDRVTDRGAWASDIVSALEALRLPPTREYLCATMAMIGQESGFQVDPVVPGLPKIAWKEIEKRRDRYGIPRILVDKIVAIRSTDGRTYKERLDTVRTERELSRVWDDLVIRLPIGQKLLGDANPIRTLGPMQVSIDFIEQRARRQSDMVPLDSDLRAIGFSRYGSIYFGAAHLFDYSAPYEKQLYRFADYNAGRYASRNAALQNAIAQVSGIRLVHDGVFLRDEEGKLPTETLSAALSLGPRIELDQAQILQDLKLSRSAELEKTKFYVRVFQLAEQQAAQSLPRALLPQLRITGPKIQRTNLTTGWFVQRVDSRYRACLARESAETEQARRKADKAFVAGW